GLSMSSVRQLSWWLITAEAFFLGLLSSLGAWFMFTLLPVSVAVLVLGAAVSTFPIVRQRVSTENHFLCVSVAWFALCILCLLLIHWRGRENFEWLLD